MDPRRLRVHEEAETVGLDWAQFVDEQIGERAILADLLVSSSSGHSSIVNEVPGGVGGRVRRARDSKDHYKWRPRRCHYLKR